MLSGMPQRRQEARRINNKTTLIQAEANPRKSVEKEVEKLGTRGGRWAWPLTRGRACLVKPSSRCWRF